MTCADGIDSIEMVIGDQDQGRHSNQAEDLFIRHIVHPITIEWSAVLDDLQAAGLIFERVTPQVWLGRVEASSDDDPSKQMLPIWRAAVSHRGR